MGSVSGKATWHLLGIQITGEIYVVALLFDICLWLGAGWLISAANRAFHSSGKGKKGLVSFLFCFWRLAGTWDVHMTWQSACQYSNGFRAWVIISANL